MSSILAVAAGGAIGSVCRYLLGLEVARVLGTGFPYGTLLVNVLGGFAMGAVVEAMAFKWSFVPELRAFVTAGILGGFTTFSAFSLETALLLERGAPAAALLYVAGSVVLSVLALFIGLHLVRAFF